MLNITIVAKEILFVYLRDKNLTIFTESLPSNDNLCMVVLSRCHRLFQPCQGHNQKAPTEGTKKATPVHYWCRSKIVVSGNHRA